MCRYGRYCQEGSLVYRGEPANEQLAINHEWLWRGKDMTIATKSSRSLGFDTPGLDLAKSLYEKLASKGGGLWNTRAV